MPKAMVFVYQPELGHSMWVDLMSRARTEAGLIRQLRRGVRAGDWNGWRLIRVEKEVIGND